MNHENQPSITSTRNRPFIRHLQSVVPEPVELLDLDGLRSLIDESLHLRVANLGGVGVYSFLGDSSEGRFTREFAHDVH